MNDYRLLAADLRRIAKEIAGLPSELFTQIDCYRFELDELESFADALESDEAEDYAKQERKDADADARMREDKAERGNW